nr:unnamed protein product [Digitaria exilis]
MHNGGCVGTTHLSPAIRLEFEEEILLVTARQGCCRERRGQSPAIRLEFVKLILLVRAHLDPAERGASEIGGNGGEIDCVLQITWPSPPEATPPGAGRRAARAAPPVGRRTAGRLVFCARRAQKPPNEPAACPEPSPAGRRGAAGDACRSCERRRDHGSETEDKWITAAESLRNILINLQYSPY